MSVNVLIDTNVLVYAYQIHDPDKQRQSVDVLDYWVKTKSVAISTQILAEFVVVSNRMEPPIVGEELRASIDRLIRSFTILPVTSFVVREAVRGMQTYQLSYWDAQVWALAHLHQVPIILTEDLSEQWHIEGVRYKNPFV